MLPRGLTSFTRHAAPLPGARRRIAVVNSNTSEAVTMQLAEAAAPALLPGTEAVFLNPRIGPVGIDTAMDMAVAGVETARLVSELEPDFDAFVVACGNDPGLAACRELTSKPVTGIAESGFLLACAYGDLFSVAVLAPHKRQNMHALVRAYRLQDRLASIVAASTSSTSAAADPDALLRQLVSACEIAQEVGPGLGGALVLPGSVMGRVAPQLSREIGIPVVSGLLAGIRAAETLCDERERSRTDSTANEERVQ